MHHGTAACSSGLFLFLSGRFALRMPPATSLTHYSPCKDNNVKNHELGEKILTGLGGSENIAHFTHCATRLRVTPADRSKVNTEQIKSIPGVL